MRYLPPIPWHAVTLGTVVLDETGTPRTVVGNVQYDATNVLIFLEGHHRPHVVPARVMITPVELDDIDAIGILYTAGLNPTPIGD